MKLSKIALALATLTVASSALAHGYVESPASRAYMCKLGKNIDCGSVQWEPQSVERTSGFPTGALPLGGNGPGAYQAKGAKGAKAAPERFQIISMPGQRRAAGNDKFCYRRRGFNGFYPAAAL